jgi:hypothetical protein
VATIAGSIAFTVTCVPTSLVLGAGLYNPLPPATMLIVFGGSGVLAVVIAGWMVRLFLPRKPD